MGYTLGEAAKAVGKSKATISKAIKSGKISATKQDDGSYSIEAVELHRVYPPTLHETVTSEQSDTPNETGKNPNDYDVLQVRLEAALQRIEDLENDREHWRQQANRLLTQQERQPAKEQLKGGFWKKLFG
jgi:hypothetical protein